MQMTEPAVLTLWNIVEEIVDAALTIPSVAAGAFLIALALILRAARLRPLPRARVGKVASDLEERARIDAFLACKRIALVGASTHPEDFSRAVMRALRERGAVVVPVHPTASDIEGQRAFTTVAEVQPPVEAVLIMTPPAQSAQVVRECAAAHVRKVWLHRGVGHGAVSDEALRVAAAERLELVAGRCPLMFLGERPAWIHRVHAGVLQLRNRYPERGRP